MIRKVRFSCSLYLSTPLVALALVGFGGCSGDGNANMAPVEGERPDSPEIEAIKKSGKPPLEIQREVREYVKAKLATGSKKPQGKKGRRP